MNAYVHKPHGLVIGSGSYFIITPHTDDIHDYTAILSFENYRFERCSTAHVHITTPAQALGWKKVTVPVPHVSRGDFAFPKHATFWKPRHWLATWLLAHAPGFGLPIPDMNHHSGEHPTIFFNKRKHALALATRFEHMLEGVNPNIHPKTARKKDRKP